VHLAELMLLPTDPWSAARLLADAAHVREAIRAAGATDDAVEVTGDGSAAFTVTSRRTLPADQVPAHLRGFVGGRLEVRQTTSWDAPDDDGARAGTVVAEVAGVPVRLDGRTTLVAHGPAATAVRYEGEVRASVPMFGAVVEELTAGAVRAALAAEAQVAARRLT